MNKNKQITIDVSGLDLNVLKRDAKYRGMTLEELVWDYLEPTVRALRRREARKKRKEKKGLFDVYQC